MTSVSVAGVVFSDEGGPSILEGLDGWFDGAPVRGEDIPRPGQHGSFGTDAKRGGRLVTVTGSVLHDSAAAAEVAQERLTALLADGGYDELTVVSPAGRALSSRVRLGGQPLVTWRPWSSTVRAQLQFFAPDPLRYSAPVSVSTTFPVLRGGLAYDLYTDGAGTDLGYLDYGEPSDTGRVVVSNPGSAAVPALFQIEGPVDPSGFDIAQVDSDRRLRFSGPVSSGSVLVLDGATGNVLIDGTADRGGLLTHRDWPLIPPGGSVELAFIPLGVDLGARLTAVVRPGSW